MSAVDQTHPIYQAGLRQGLELAAALLEGRASMAVEMRRVSQGEALELAARAVRRLGADGSEP